MKILFACSVYDTNPVHFISMCCVIIFWTVNIISMFDPIYGSMHQMQFLRLNINYDYKNNMNSVDIINQLCNQ